MIKVLDNFGRTADRYTVIIDDELWFMSDNANMPNGVCMFGGLLDEYNWQDLGIEIEIDAIPTGTNKQINYIIAQEY
jgi:hypothetical protein